MMAEFSTIVLTGFMASGKTLVAGALGRLLRWPIIDLDELICEREQRSIHSIIQQDGEDFFRIREARALREVLMNPTECVIALGGGAWAFEPNRRLIAERECLTLWLDAPFELCWERITNDGSENKRPLAQSRDQAYLLYEQRRPLYKLATLRIKTDEGMSAESVASEILRLSAGNNLGHNLQTSES